MQFYELMYWASLIALVMAAICIGITGFRNSAWYGPRKKLFEEVSPLDLKLMKIAALFFVAGILFFLIGTTAR